MMAQPGAPKDITPRMVDWILHNLPTLRAQIESIEPQTSTSLAVLNGRTRPLAGGVEGVAIKRASVSAVLDAVDRGIKSLRPEQRRVYRLRYRAGMGRKGICGRVYLSEGSLGRRLAEIRDVVARHLEQVPASERAAFTRHFRSRAP